MYSACFIFYVFHTLYLLWIYCFVYHSSLLYYPLLLFICFPSFLYYLSLLDDLSYHYHTVAVYHVLLFYDPYWCYYLAIIATSCTFMPAGCQHEERPPPG